MIRVSLMRAEWLLPVVLLGLCRMADGQATPAPAASLMLPVATRSAAADTGKAAVPSVSAQPLSPQQQRLVDEADQLLNLAQRLKTEVDKTNQYTLSLSTLRRADDIEKLAKTLQKEMPREDR